MKSLNSILTSTILIFISCSQDQVVLPKREIKSQQIVTKCTLEDKPKIFELGDLICAKRKLKLSKNESIKIVFNVTNENSDDPYEYGIQELHRIKNGKIVETFKLRKDGDAYWSEVPFVRIRKKQYLADLDNDGFKEFAVFPFHPGSAIWGTVRIFSVKKKIEFWGLGRYQFENDTYVKLGCMDCSKFNPDACSKCY